jgi:hypothetical protein
MNFFFGILLMIVGQLLAFVQMQGHYKFPWLKNNLWFGVLLGVPISAIFMYGIHLLIKQYDGAMWPSRIIGFSVGTTVYALMAYYWFNEQVTTKTAICLFLSLLIILVQVFWKE